MRALFDVRALYMGDLEPTVPVVSEFRSVLSDQARKKLDSELVENGIDLNHHDAEASARGVRKYKARYYRDEGVQSVASVCRISRSRITATSAPLGVASRLYTIVFEKNDGHAPPEGQHGSDVTPPSGVFGSWRVVGMDGWLRLPEGGGGQAQIGVRGYELR